jgi:hypothetical protein
MRCLIIWQVNYLALANGVSSEPAGADVAWGFFNSGRRWQSCPVCHDAA